MYVYCKTSNTKMDLIRKIFMLIVILIIRSVSEVAMLKPICVQVLLHGLFLHLQILCRHFV